MFWLYFLIRKTQVKVKSFAILWSDFTSLSELSARTAHLSGPSPVGSWHISQRPILWWYLLHVEPDPCCLYFTLTKPWLLYFFKERKGTKLDILFFFFSGPGIQWISPVCYAEMIKARNYLLPGLQDIINNTSLAELEKRLKETPFNPPKVGKKIKWSR